jgi:GAF domain-containing protein
MSDQSSPDDVRRFADLEQALASEADPERALQRVLEEARAVTAARYAALGALDSDRVELRWFLSSGMDAAARQAVGGAPRGRGVLGVLITDPRPLRLANVTAHARAYGFPAGHPPMRTFLGVPIMIGEAPWGNLYLTDKEDGGEFTDADEAAAVHLADTAAAVIARAPN